jgi:hypothetical protein
VITLPLAAGGVHETDASWLPATACTPVGASGAVAGRGVTEFDGTEAELVPDPLVAVTVKVYAVVLESPVTVAAVCVPSTVADAPPGDAVTV